MKFKKNAITDQQPSMNVPGVAAWLGDTFISADKDKTICAGFFHLEAGNPLDYTYDYEEMKVIVEGEFIITEVKTGQKVNAQVGDVLYFADGDRIIFDTPKRAVGFFCGQRQPL
ncbi:MAG: cupin domain-containing protein [Methylophilaceae bacterium]